MTDITQDLTYFDRFEVSESSQQLDTLKAMIVRNNKTGFEFSSTTDRYFRVYFKEPINIALVQVLTPRSNVKQIRLSYFDDFNRTITDKSLQEWPINYVSQEGRENNSLDKLCQNIAFRGIQVNILQTEPASSLAFNATLKIFVRHCEGIGGRIRKYCTEFIRHNGSFLG